MVIVTNGTGSGNYEVGETVTIVANTPPAGQQFKEWQISPVVTFVGGNVNTSSAIFIMPAQAVTVTAVYEIIPVDNYTITVNIEGNGIANANVQSAPSATLITLTAIPNSGNRFVMWEVVSGNITLSNSMASMTTFTMPSENVTVKAKFENETSIGDINGNTYIKIYPNPVKDILIIDNGKSLVLRLN